MKQLEQLFIGLSVLSLASCSDSNDPDNNDISNKETAKETVLREAAEAYVDFTVVPTYKNMADATVELMDLCNKMQEKYENGNLSTADIEAAGKSWKNARKSWELSEAFLFGPASSHNIDPHIDSWPLDKAAMDDLLSLIRAGKSWSLDNNGGYGLIGFHAIEYMLFQLSADGNTAQVHSTSYTPEELEYLCAVAEDLCQQATCLEACWAGTENISERKQGILEDAELDYGENYGWEMKNAGKPGSRMKTYQEVAEEIIQGCIDIADEVGNTKIGRPHMGSTEEDKNYIESPYSLNSVEDFADNIRSIRNAYTGSYSGSPSVSDYIKSIDASLDTEIRNTIEAAIQAIEAIPEPFAKNATGELAGKASDICGDTLAAVLEKAHAAITKN